MFMHERVNTCILYSCVHETPAAAPKGHNAAGAPSHHSRLSSIRASILRIAQAQLCTSYSGTKGEMRKDQICVLCRNTNRDCVYHHGYDD